MKAVVSCELPIAGKGGGHNFVELIEEFDDLAPVTLAQPALGERQDGKANKGRNS
jgi:hypothetical protein